MWFLFFDFVARKCSLSRSTTTVQCTSRPCTTVVVVVIVLRLYCQLLSLHPRTLVMNCFEYDEEISRKMPESPVCASCHVLRPPSLQYTYKIYIILRVRTAPDLSLRQVRVQIWKYWSGTRLISSRSHFAVNFDVSKSLFEQVFSFWIILI